MGKPKKPIEASAMRTGRWLVFGAYGRTTPEPILWKVVDVAERGVTVAADSVLTVKPFDTVRPQFPTGQNRWRDSVARHWLNSAAPPGKVDFGPHPAPTGGAIWIPEHWKDVTGEDFAFDGEKGFLAYFTDAERGCLVEVEIASQLEGPSSSRFDTTRDRVFLPSNEEMESWLFRRKTNDYGAVLTDAATEDSPWSEGGDFGWWQRDAFNDPDDVTCVNGSRAVGWEPAASCYAGYRPLMVLAPSARFLGSGMAKNPYRLMAPDDEA